MNQPRPLTASTGTAITISGVRIPDSKLAQEITELVCDTESPLLFYHSSRVFYWGALTGARRGLTVDAELLVARAAVRSLKHVIAFILFSGIALTPISACAPLPGDTGPPTQTSLNMPCPWQEGYPDCHR